MHSRQKRACLPARGSRIVNWSYSPYLTFHLSTMDTDAIRNFVKEQVSYLKDHKIEPSEVKDDQLLFNVDEEAVDNSLGLDSLDGVELAMALESEFDLGTPEEIDLKQFRTVDDIVSFVVDLLGQKPTANA